jgi:hypothetical protein
MQTSMFKTAGAEAALIELGLAAPAHFEKEAFVGGLLARGAMGIGRGIWGLGKGLFGAAAGVSNRLAAPIGNLGNQAVQRAGQALGASPKMIGQVQGLGKGMAREGMGFGLLGGGANAALADPGQRGEAFARGFGGGMLGGMAWRGAGNLATAGLKRGLGAQRYSSLTETAKPGFTGNLFRDVAKDGKVGPVSLRSMGAKALIGGVPFAGGIAASMYTPTFEKDPTPFQQAARYPASLGGNMLANTYPNNLGYNPNLPLPQGGY